MYVEAIDTSGSKDEIRYPGQTRVQQNCQLFVRLRIGPTQKLSHRHIDMCIKIFHSFDDATIYNGYAVCTFHKSDIQLQLSYVYCCIAKSVAVIECTRNINI